jgi:hypothetical protein
MWIEVAMIEDFRTLGFQFSKCTIVNVSEDSKDRNPDPGRPKKENFSCSVGDQNTGTYVFGPSGSGSFRGTDPDPDVNVASTTIKQKCH